MQTDSNDDYSAIHPQDLPYLKFESLAGRPIPIHTFHDGKRWHIWAPLKNGLLQPIRVHECIEMIYLAQEPAKHGDAYFRFINFIYKHIELKHTRSFLTALISDVLNLGASLRKIDILKETEHFEGKSRLVTTEVEYLLLLCRSMFDLLQEIVLRIWNTIQLLDTSTKKKTLPSSFRKVVLLNENILSSEEIQNRFGLTPALSKWYAECAPFFCKLRDVRDAIVHKPVSEPLIYTNDKGFSIGIDSSPVQFREMLHWPEQVIENGRIGPLNYFVAHFVHETLASCENFVAAVTKEIRVLPDFSPGFTFFMRSPSTASLLGIQRILSVDPWAEFTLSESFLNEHYDSKEG